MVRHSLRVLGVSFTTAPVAVRESLSYGPEAALALLGSASIEGLDEALVVSTCNRTEFYLGVRGEADVEADWLGHVRARRPQALIAHDVCRFFHARDDDAVRHLCHVACGLDSAILGDAHIGTQLKQALALAAQAGTLGPILDQTFQHAFAVIKEAQTSTEIGRGHASLGSAVAGLVRERRGADARVLIIGAGVAARDIARQLSKWRVGALTIVNRTAATAEILAQQVGARAAAWRELDKELAEADVIVAATSAQAPLLTRDRLAVVGRSRAGCVPLVIDTGVPRNVEPMNGIDCVTIDDIAVRRDEALVRRQRAVPAVEAIIQRAVARWQRWRWAQPGETLLRTVFEEEAARRTELVDRLVAAGFPGQREDLDCLVRRAWRPLLKTHARDLRSWLRETALPMSLDESPSMQMPGARFGGGL
jgi:glutamyl-tRNA reductase